LRPRGQPAALAPAEGAAEVSSARRLVAGPAAAVRVEAEGSSALRDELNRRRAG
jgi:hypothetical protein